jgi:hypothetical protein
MRASSLVLGSGRLRAGMGLYPLPFTEVMHASVDDLLAHVAQQANCLLNTSAGP